MKKFLSFIVLALLISMLSIAYADEIQPYASELFNSTSVLVTPNSNGTTTFAASATATGSIDKLGFTSLTIQAYIDGSWQSVYRISNKYSYNSSLFAYSYTYDSVEGRKYRMVVNFYASDGSTTDTRTRTSGSVTSK